MLICGCFGPFIETYDEPLLYSLNDDVMERTAYDSSSLANYTTVVSVSQPKIKIFYRSKDHGRRI